VRFSATRPALEAAAVSKVDLVSRGGFLYFLFSEERLAWRNRSPARQGWGFLPSGLGITVAQITARLSFVLDVTDIKPFSRTLSINADAINRQAILLMLGP